MTPEPANLTERTALADRHAELAAKYRAAGSTLLADIHADEARRLRRDLPQQEGEQ